VFEKRQNVALALKQVEVEKSASAIADGGKNNGTLSVAIITALSKEGSQGTFLDGG
jgi:hypothetical protein